MNTQLTELSEFHRQLGLLVQADLPLPGSLRSLAHSAADSRFRAVLERLAADVENGVPLAAAMARHHDWFPPLHVRLVEAGQKSGTLSQVLFEVAEIARLDAALSRQLRDLAAYPAFVILFAGGLFLLVLRFVIQELGVQANQFGVALPAVSRLVYAAAGLVTAHGVLIATLYAALLGVVIWVLAGAKGASQTTRLRALRVLPGFGGIVAGQDAARLCAVWSVLTARGVPLADVLEACAGMVEDSRLAAALQQVAGRTATGTPLRTCLESSDALPESIRLVLLHAPEQDVPERLRGIREWYIDQVVAAGRRAGVVWHVGAFSLMAIAAGGAIIGAFLPLIQLVRALSGS